MFGGGFKASKCKTLLRLAMARIKLLRNKRDIQVKQMRKDIAQLLQTGQEPSARIRVEHIAREQNVMAAYDILELFCELIIVRLPIIEAQKVCPMDLKEAVSSLIFAAPRCADLPELIQIRTLFTTKYGKEFVAAAAELRPDCGVNRRIIEKLSVRAPPGEVKLKLLKEIAEEFKVEWDPADTEAELLKRHEDLLDGPKQFYGASSAPLSDDASVSASVSESSSLPRKAQDVPVHPAPPPPPPSAPSAPPPIQMLPLDQSSEEDSSPEINSSSKTQYIPFVGPHPSQRVPAESTTIPGRSSGANTSSTSGKYGSPKRSSRSDSYSQSKKEGHLDYENVGPYVNVDEAVQAAAEYSKRAATAARAAAALRRSQSLSPSPPRSRRVVHHSNADSDDDDDSEEEERPHRPNDRRRHSRRNAEGALKHERESAPKRSDSDKSRKGATFTKENVGEEKEFSFRMGIQEDPKLSLSKRSNSGDREDASFRRTKSDERRESFYRSNSEDSKVSVARSSSDNRDEVLFRRNGSRERGGIFSKNDEDQQESTVWKIGSESRADFDVEPPRKVDPEMESFWPVDQDWRSEVDKKIADKIDSGIFTGKTDEEDTEYLRKSSVPRKNDHGRSGDGSYSNASNIFSRADSAESNLFKRGDSEELDMRSSDEFYDTKQGFATPKFDDEEHLSSLRNPRQYPGYEEESLKRNSSSSSKSSSNDFWKTGSRSDLITEEDEAFVRKYSFAGREDLKPLEKARSDSLFESNSRVVLPERIDRAGSDPVYSRLSAGEESKPSKLETSISVKSRRTRMNRDKIGDGESPGSPFRRSKTDNQEDSSSTLDDSPYKSRPIPFRPSPSSNSSAYQSPETQRESPPPNTLTPSASGSSPGSVRRVQQVPPDIDDLTARFEALKAAKR